MTGRLILIKHAMPRIEAGVPSKDWMLSDAGREAAARLAEQLRRFDPAALVASPEPKALETGRIIAGRLGLDCAVDEGLTETRRETIGWLSREAIEVGIQRFFDEPGDLVFGEETADEAHARFSRAIERHRLAGETVVVVCHGTVISLYVSRLSGADPMAVWRQQTLPHALVLGADGEVAESIAAS